MLASGMPMNNGLFSRNWIFVFSSHEVLCSECMPGSFLELLGVDFDLQGLMVQHSQGVI